MYFTLLVVLEQLYQLRIFGLMITQYLQHILLSLKCVDQKIEAKIYVPDILIHSVDTLYLITFYVKFQTLLYSPFQNGLRRK